MLVWLNRAGLVIFGLTVFLTLGYFQKQVPAEFFNSPDEAANYWFAKEVYKIGAPVFYDGRNLKSEGLVGMRSTRAVGEKIVPGSFLGLPMVTGYFGKIFGARSLIYFTPLLLALALTALWDLIRRTCYNRFVAWLVTFIAFLSPPTLFFGSHSMFHNGAFLAMIILGLWASVAATQKKYLPLYFLAGLFFGTALFFRTNEIVWVGPIFLIIALTMALIYHKKTKPTEKIPRDKKNKIFLTLAHALPWLGFFIPFSWLFQINYQLYGSIFSFGNYAPDLAASLTQQPLTLLQQLLVPFGLHPSIMTEVFSDYFVVMMWPLSFLIWWGIIGALYYWPRLSRYWRGAFVIYLVVSAWLVVLYGSWEFFDHPVLKLATIGTSYIRYFWPIWILGLIFLAKVWSLWSDRETKYRPLKRPAAAWIILCLIVVFYAPWAVLKAYTSVPEGLLNSLIVFTQNNAVAEKVIKTTSKDAVILAHTMDKVIWPRRQVIYKLQTPQTKNIVTKMLRLKIPLYELQMTYSESLWRSLNEKEYGPAGFKLGQALWTEQGWSLYQFQLVK